MIDPDISTADALRLLSTPDTVADRFGVSRRRFLQGIGAGMAGAMAGGLHLPGFLGWDEHMAHAAPIGANDGILLIVGMYGGNDGLRMVAPYSNPHYDRLRNSVQVTAAQGQILNGDYAFAPELVGLKSRWDAGKVAVVHGCGYANPDLSHFSSMAYWMSGRPNGVPTSGWIGRWMDEQATDDIFRVATVGYSIPLHLQGTTRRAIGVPPWGVSIGGNDGDDHQAAYTAFKAFANRPPTAPPWVKAIGSNISNVITVGETMAPIFDEDVHGPFPQDDLARRMVVAARMINANVGLRVIDMGYGDFDHHSGELESHPARMTEFDNAVTAFFAELDPAWASRVTIMTFSEFGRTPFDNESQGTDHGTSHPMLVIGDGVRGGFYGKHPDLASMQNDWDRMEHTVDFRSVYASVIDGWLGGGSSDVLGGTFEDLRLFRRGPGGAGPVAPQLRVQSDHVTLAPTRLWSSTNGTGVPALTRKVSAREIVTLQVAGRAGVPSMTQANPQNVPTAVVLHVTASQASVATDVTVWAADDPRPVLTSGSVTPGRTETSVVVTRIGPDGKVNLYNSAGSAHYTIDVVGYFRGASGNHITPLSPATVADTRSGTGVTKGRSRSIEVDVTGVGGVPSSGVTSVIVNITCIEPRADATITAWPTGAAKPSVPCDRAQSGGTTRRLTVVKVGRRGRISVASSATCHLVVDVVGWIGSSGARRTITNEPVAVLDTRRGVGRAAGTLGASTVSVNVRGVGDIPSSGVSAVLLHVTASGGTRNGDLTVWTAGRRRPAGPSLAVERSRATSNLVLVKPSADGKVSVRNSAGAVHVRADVVAWLA